MLRIGFPTRKRLWTFLGCCLAVIALPTCVFVGQIVSNATGGDSRTSTTSLRIARVGNRIVVRDVPASSAPPSGEPVELIGDVTITVQEVMNTDRDYQAMHVDSTFTTTWTPARPSDDDMEDVIRAWSDPIDRRQAQLFGWYAGSRHFKLSQLLTAPSGSFKRRDWERIVADAWRTAGPAYAGCGVLGAPVLIGLYVGLRYRARRTDICPHCSYPSTGLTTHTCPECGTNLSHPPK